MREIERNVIVFATNLDRLMMRCGKRNATLARDVGVSREMVAVWRQGKSLPSEDHSEQIAYALGVKEIDLYTVVEDDAPMLAIAQWAKRENIPVARAKSLFELGILTGMETVTSTTVRNGERISETVQMVPLDVRAPADSKHLVRVARRPHWVAAFSINLDNRMRELQMRNIEMAEATGVTQCAVTHWRSGRGYPLEERLPVIANKVGCDVDTLIAEPLERWATTWKFRFNHAKVVDEVAEEAAA